MRQVDFLMKRSQVDFLMKGSHSVGATDSHDESQTGHVTEGGGTMDSGTGVPDLQENTPPPGPNLRPMPRVLEGA